MMAELTPNHVRNGVSLIIMRIVEQVLRRKAILTPTN